MVITLVCDDELRVPVEVKEYDKEKAISDLAQGLVCEDTILYDSSRNIPVIVKTSYIRQIIIDGL